MARAAHGVDVAQALPAEDPLEAMLVAVLARGDLALEAMAREEREGLERISGACEERGCREERGEGGGLLHVSMPFGL